MHWPDHPLGFGVLRGLGREVRLAANRSDRADFSTGRVEHGRRREIRVASGSSPMARPGPERHPEAMTRPTPSSQSRTRGLVPRFRYGYTDQHIRVSDAERTEMADRLAAHFAEGRLNQAEFDERVAQR
jgi:Domain of unknown function (DUF1707)